ncbi:MAG: hypothetical protein MJ180_03030, partial [Candidatus Gastranaerophilales bacterium]|nr:hypothetical protein [Candidatus Gastranaerophilales bacterium]
EGARNNNVFGTYLHGAILPKNPAFCDYLLERAIQNKTGDNNYVISAIDDVFENLTHKELIKIAH